MLWFSCYLITIFIVLPTYLAVHNNSVDTVKNYSHHHHNYHRLWDCNRPWPSLSLFLSVKSYTNSKDPDFYELESMFLRTFAFFWPVEISNTSVILAYDEEFRGSFFISTLQATVNSLPVKVPGGIELVGIPYAPYYTSGYNRQQWNMFWADNFTSSEHVGFCDTDTAFITYVDREDLFENDKPVVNARGGRHLKQDDGVNGWTNGTYAALGILEPFKCMSYFPVIVKTAHLPLLRKFIEQHHNMSFNEAFRHHIQSIAFSQFGIMCTFLWSFHRDEYTWYVHSESPEWDGVNPPPVTGQDPNQTQFTEAMKQPKPRIATHVSYRRSPQNQHMSHIGDFKHRQEFSHFMALGYCYSPPFPHNESACAGVNPLSYYYEMHNFDFVAYEFLQSKESMNHQAVVRHHRLRHCNHTWNPELRVFIPENV